MNSDIPLYLFLVGFCILAFSGFYLLFVVALREDPMPMTPSIQCECLNNTTTYVYPTCPVVQEQAPATIRPTVTVAPTPTPYPEVRAQPDGYPRDTMPCCGVVTRASEFPFLGGA